MVECKHTVGVSLQLCTHQSFTVCQTKCKQKEENKSQRQQGLFLFRPLPFPSVSFNSINITL